MIKSVADFGYLFLSPIFAASLGVCLTANGAPTALLFVRPLTMHTDSILIGGTIMPRQMTLPAKHHALGYFHIPLGLGVPPYVVSLFLRGVQMMQFQL